jgi:dissimilatory sulfite reductase (desulfoviridin) alpha/beta subunit
VGAEPRLAQEIKSGLNDAQILEAVEKVVACYKQNAKKGERIGKTIDRLGLDLFKNSVSSLNSAA